MTPEEIIVGVDGSATSIGALRWAAREASLRRAELVVLHVYDWRIYGAPSPIGARFVTDVKQVVESIVDDALAAARAVAPDVRVRGEALMGNAGATLVAASSARGTIVLGNRGRGGFGSLLLGSVSQHVATHAACPVVVVRGRADAATGPVVVGADDSSAGRYAIGAAFEQAATRGAGILAVRVFPSSATMWGPEVVAATPEDAEEHRQAELDAVTADVAPWRDKFPDVDVECVAVEGHPASVLNGLSAMAQLVVVGTRGRGGFAGLLLGSTSQQLLHHADSPVLIAREHVES